ncbi:MAG: asparagine synthase-related protein [Candidatus Helarchaeota archaeon]
MGFIAGCISRDGSDVSEILYRMAHKLKHRGNSPLCIFSRQNSGWEYKVVTKSSILLEEKCNFGVVGRHLEVEGREAAIPFCDCLNTRFLLLDGFIYNLHAVNMELRGVHKTFPEDPSLLVHLIEELQSKVFSFTAIFQKLYLLVEGMFAGALFLKNHLFIFRDIVGLKPLFLYSGPRYIAFASEKKALWNVGFTGQIESLRPGRVIRVDRRGFTSHFQATLQQHTIQKKPVEYYLETLKRLLSTAVKQGSSTKPFYVLLSGGIDSTIIAALCKKLELECKNLVVGSEKSKDIQAAQVVTDTLEQPLEILQFDMADLITWFPQLLYALEDRDEKKLNIAFPLFYGTQYIKRRGGLEALAGQGADELFGGYERYEVMFRENPARLQTALWKDVKNLSSVNLERDDAATMANGVELRLPYLTRATIEFAMQIPVTLKLRPPTRKYILRQLGKMLELPNAIVEQRKRAIQFSSGSYSTLKKLAKAVGFTKDFVLQHGFFSPTQTFIDSLAYLLGFPFINPKMAKFIDHARIHWPESFLEYRNWIQK